MPQTCVLSGESSPAPQLRSVRPSALSLLYGPTLTSVRDYWKNHSFDYVDLCSISQTLMYLGSPTIAGRNTDAQAPALEALIQQDGEGGQGICIFNT